MIGDERGTWWVRWAVINILLACAACGLTLWIWSAEQELRDRLLRVMQRQKQGCAPRVIQSGAVQLVDPEHKVPPQDPPRSGYFGPKGTDLTPAMGLPLEALRAGQPATLESLRFGAQEVLPADTIHVVNLWATWCGPCKAELPDFAAMFARHPDWGAEVRFLPVLVKDANEPRKSYQDFAAVMPPAPVKLADRSYEQALLQALAPDAARTLFHGQLPVTLVLDCNRRVRWARFEQLAAADFAELEGHIASLRAELRDTSPGAWCTQAWAGNGRCEGQEHSAAHHSLADCGELRRRSGAGPP